MPPLKKVFQDRAAILNGRLASPKKAIKRVTAIALSPVKARAQKKHRNADPEDHDETEPIAAEKENEDVFLADTDPVAQYQSEFHQGSTPETPTAAPTAFKLKGKIFIAENPGHHDDDNMSAHTFPTSRPPSVLANSDNDDALDIKIVPRNMMNSVPPMPVFLCPSPPETFVEKMAALGTKQALCAAPDITSAKAALVDIQLVLRGPSRGKSGGYIPPDFSPWVRVRMEGIRSHLALYSNPNSTTYGKWGLSARQAAIAVGRDVYCARRFASLSREYITSRKVLPINPYGMWRQAMLADEDLATDVSDKLVDYLSREDVMDKHGLDKKISVRTARRYLNELGDR
ncbi:hypothetical protein B0H17DRAFT_1140953 [Mycena rosella]|uniref:Uncharacterized protein n=1 Tax=Mycena rosella TaxID=1033263 RepID=A0AAD7D4H8_MYCRO|nr:hypothetical protein B0H17DRAFT_1140953 [Mycena rosella]